MIQQVALIIVKRQYNYCKSFHFDKNDEKNISD